MLVMACEMVAVVTGLAGQRDGPLTECDGLGGPVGQHEQLRLIAQGQGEHAGLPGPLRRRHRLPAASLGAAPVPVAPVHPGQPAQAHHGGRSSVGAIQRHGLPLGLIAADASPSV